MVARMLRIGTLFALIVVLAAACSGGEGNGGDVVAFCDLADETVASEGTDPPPPATIRDLVDAAPDDIDEEVERVARPFLDAAEAEDDQAVREAMAATREPEFQEANQAVEQFLTEECGIDSASDDSAPDAPSAEDATEPGDTTVETPATFRDASVFKDVIEPAIDELIPPGGLGIGMRRFDPPTIDVQLAAEENADVIAICEAAAGAVDEELGDDSATLVITVEGEETLAERPGGGECAAS